MILRLIRWLIDRGWLKVYRQAAIHAADAAGNVIEDQSA